MHQKPRVFTALIMLLCLTLYALPIVAQVQPPIVLTQTNITAHGERELPQATTPFDVTDPTGAILETRQFKYTTPSNFATRGIATVNLWVVFHGGGGNTNTMNRYFDIIPDSAPTVLIFPEAVNLNGNTQWRGVQSSSDVWRKDTFYDIIFIDQLVNNLLVNNQQLHEGKVYATGFSSGANMTWMLLCYRSKPFQGFSMHSQQLTKAKRDGGCGDGRLLDPVSGQWTGKTGYEKLTGTQADRYGYNPHLPVNKRANKTKAVLYSHGTYDDNLVFTGSAGCSTSPATCSPGEDPDSSMDAGGPNQNRDDISTKDWLLDRHDLLDTNPAGTILPDEDPFTYNDLVETTERTYSTSLGTPGVTSRKTISWLEMVGGVHALSAFDHEGDECSNYDPPPNMPPKSDCNLNLNASKDYETSTKVKEFFEAHAGMLP